MGTYAAKTEVPSTKSRDEIERTLTRFGATSFAYGTEPGRAMVGFVIKGIQVRLVLPLPDSGDREFTLTPTGRLASTSATEAAYEQAVRQKWRALALVVKAKLEAVESDISTFEQEFYSTIVLPNGWTVWEQTHEQVHQALSVGVVPPLLQLGSAS